MKDIITRCKERGTEALDGFLRAISFVPEDKLEWSPTPTAKSALQIAVHCAGYSGAFATIIRAGRFPCTGEEFRSGVQSTIDGIATLEQAKVVLQKGMAECIAALDTVKLEQVDEMIETPHFRVPFSFFLTLPGYHLEGHEAQINYLQTCWNDQVVHLKRESHTAQSVHST